MPMAGNTNTSMYDGRWLRRQRRLRGLYQHQLAALLDINQGRISEWENGEPIPPERLVQLQVILS